MSAIARAEVQNGGDVATFDPKKTATKNSFFDSVRKQATKLKDWESLHQAVAEQIDEQTRFVGWWDANVTGNRHNVNPRPENTDRRFLSANDANKLTGISQQQVSRWRGRLKDRQKYTTLLYGAAYKRAMESAAQLNQQSLDNEHYTPQKYLEAARAVMGGVDLDPASCAAANEVVAARTFFDIEDDGLTQGWAGRVWLNPPYGKMVGPFVAKLVDEINTGRVNEAVVLVNAHCTDTAWFQPLWNGTLCFTDHRINFYGDDTRSGSTHGSVFVYFGPSVEKFIKAFSPFGAVVARRAA